MHWNGLFSPLARSLLAMFDRQAFLEQPSKLSKAVDDGIRSMGMLHGARKNLFEPDVFPSGTVEKHCSDCGPFCRRYISGTVPEIPA